MSKVTGIPMIEWAVMVQLGVSLDCYLNEKGLLAEPNYYSVKAPVFSRSKLKGVDHVLGPEMKSTGEVLGLGATFHEALEKAFPTTGGETENYLFCSISDREKQASLPIIQQFVNKNYKISCNGRNGAFPTEKWAFLLKKSLRITQMLMNFSKTIPLNAVINIPNQGRNKIKFGFYIREQATRYNVPVFTHLDTVEAIIGLQAQSITIQKYGL